MEFETGSYLFSTLWVGGAEGGEEEDMVEVEMWN